MVLVTDKQYYMQHHTKDMIDFFIKRQEKKWDNFIIVDGVVGTGKSTISQLIAYYYAFTKQISFNIDNVFFDPEEMIKVATETYNSVIIWDESALGGMSTQSRSKLAVRIIQAMMTARSRGHFWIFCIPSFFKLNEYLAVDRSVALIHCYSPNMIDRGMYKVYNYREKEKMYDNRHHKKFYPKGSFAGEWYNKNIDVIPVDVYERKKDEAIKKFFAEGTGDKYKDKYTDLVMRATSLMNYKSWQELTGKSQTNYYEYRNKWIKSVAEGDL